MPRAEYPDGDIRGERMDAVTDSALYLAEHLDKVPVLMIPCLRGRVENRPSFDAVVLGVALPGGVEDYCLALRSRGLGSCWTTFHLLAEGEEQTAEVLGIPYDEYSQGGLFPIAYTKGTDFRPAKRLPVEDVVTGTAGRR